MTPAWPPGEVREFLWVPPAEMPARLAQGWLFGKSRDAPCLHHRYARLMWRVAA